MLHHISRLVGKNDETRFTGSILIPLFSPWGLSCIFDWGSVNTWVVKWNRILAKQRMTEIFRLSSSKYIAMALAPHTITDSWRWRGILNCTVSSCSFSPLPEEFVVVLPHCKDLNNFLPGYSRSCSPWFRDHHHCCGPRWLRRLRHHHHR